MALRDDDPYRAGDPMRTVSHRRRILVHRVGSAWGGVVGVLERSRTAQLLAIFVMSFGIAGMVERRIDDSPPPPASTAASASTFASAEPTVTAAPAPLRSVS